MPDFYFLGGETVHYPLSNGVDEVSEQFFLLKRVLSRCDSGVFCSAILRYLRSIALQYMRPCDVDFLHTT